MKTKKRIVFFIALLSLLYCVTIMQDTYAKYLSSATENAELTIARWSILINDQDVVNESNFMAYYLFVGVLPFILFRYVLVFLIASLLYKRLSI